MHMNYLLFISFLLNLSIGIFVFFKHPRNFTHRFFALIAWCLAFWCLVLFLRLYFINNIFFYKLTFATPFILPTLFLHFSYIFPTKIPYSGLWRIFYWLTGVSIFILWPWSVESLDQFGNRQDGIVTKVFVVYMIVFTLLTVKNFWKQYANSDDAAKVQLHYFLIGFICMFLVSSITNGVLPLYGMRDLYICGPLSSSFFVACTMYAVLMYRFFNIDIALHKRMIRVAYIIGVGFAFAVVFAGIQMLNLVFTIQIIFYTFLCVTYYVCIKFGIRCLDPHLFFEHLGPAVTVLNKVIHENIRPYIQDIEKKLHIWCEEAAVQCKESYILSRENYVFEELSASKNIHAEDPKAMSLYFLRDIVYTLSQLSLMRGRYNKALLDYMLAIDANALLVLRAGSSVIGFVFVKMHASVNYARLETCAAQASIEFEQILSLKESLFAVENSKQN